MGYGGTWMGFQNRARCRNQNEQARKRTFSMNSQQPLAHWNTRPGSLSPIVTFGEGGSVSQQLNVNIPSLSFLMNKTWSFRLVFLLSILASHLPSASSSHELLIVHLLVLYLGSRTSLRLVSPLFRWNNGR